MGNVVLPRETLGPPVSIVLPQRFAYLKRVQWILPFASRFAGLENIAKAPREYAPLPA